MIVWVFFCKILSLFCFHRNSSPAPYPLSLLTWNVAVQQLSMISSVWMASQWIWSALQISYLWKISTSWHSLLLGSRNKPLPSKIVCSSRLTLPHRKENTDQDFVEQICHRASCHRHILGYFSSLWVAAVEQGLIDKKVYGNYTNLRYPEM